MKRRRTITVILAVLAVLILIAALVTTAPRDQAVVPTEGPDEERQAAPETFHEEPEYPASTPS